MQRLICFPHHNIILVDLQLTQSPSRFSVHLEDHIGCSRYGYWSGPNQTTAKSKALGTQ